MPVQLRGHHFLCILTYRGYGYTPAFVANMTGIVADIGNGHTVKLVEGPDDICNGLTLEDRRACNHDCGKAETLKLDRVAVEDVGRFLGVDLAEPLNISRAMIETLRSAFAEHAIRRACKRCLWSDFCTDIATNGFSGAKLFTPET